MYEDFQSLHTYVYEGPVMEFSTCVSNKWRGETVASSVNKARSNLMYQFKKQTNRLPGTRIKLPGEIKMVN